MANKFFRDGSFFNFSSSEGSFLKYKKNMRLESSIARNMRFFLILKLESSISWNIRNFFKMDFFFFFFFFFGLKMFQGDLYITTIFSMLLFNFGGNVLHWSPYIHLFKTSFQSSSYGHVLVSLLLSLNIIDKLIY